MFKQGYMNKQNIHENNKNRT